MAVMLISFTSCEGEKDLIIYEGNLPIKASALYMVGDFNGWNIGDPTPMEISEDDPLVFNWEGALKAGTMKLCLATGSWDNPFIRPLNADEEITRKGIENATFKMHAGDPDDKWKIVDEGIYHLTFDLRNWLMSASFVAEMPEAPEVPKEAIETDELFMVGDFNGWNIGDPTRLEKKSQYIFTYDGPLTSGEIKLCLSAGDWGVAFIRPLTNGCKINRDGVEDSNFVYHAGDDDKWRVEENGIYFLSFDLQNWTITAEYKGEYKVTPKIYMIGDATAGGWGWDNATIIEATEENDKVFVWEGEFMSGNFKASEEKDYGAPFYRPAEPNVEVSDKGVASQSMIFTTSPDDQWYVTVAGRYRVTFDTEKMTFDATYIK